MRAHQWTGTVRRRARLAFWHPALDLRGDGNGTGRITDRTGNATPESNPNGAMNNIAGIRNARGNVLGLMPHPERVVDPLLGSPDGLPLFESIMAEVAA